MSDPERRDHADRHGDHGHEQHDDHEHHRHEQPLPEEAAERSAHGRDVDTHGGHQDHGAHDGDPGDHGDHGDHGGHGGHGGHGVDHRGHEEMFRQRFWVSLILSIPVLLYSEALQEWLGFTMPAFPGSGWITPLFSTIVFFYGGLPFLQMARPELANRRPAMMTLISLAITVAYVYSLATLFLPEQMPFFWELVTLVVIMLLGHWIEMRSVRRASGALQELARLMPDTAERITDGGVEDVPVTELQDGDLVLVRPGASLPADGEVQEGESDVNEAMITGESRPVGVGPGDEVIAGTINGDGSLRVRVTATGDRTALAGIMRLVDEAQQSKSETQLLADRAAGWLFWVALAVAALTGVVWTAITGFDTFTVARVATVLVIACPHALGLAIPLVVAITTSLGARNGVLIRNRVALEEARHIDTMVFDKTGTLTRGEFGVVDVLAVGEGLRAAEWGSARRQGDTDDGGWDPLADRALALAAAVEGDSEHTIARGIRRTAEERNLSLPAVSGFEAIKGRGVRATVESQDVYVGGPRLLEMLALEVPEALREFTEQASAKGQSAIYLVRDGEVLAGLALADVIRPESHEAVRRLHEMGIEVAMLTGDSEAVARAVAQELGIDTYYAEVLPEHKDQKVADLQAQGRRVAMVGDGVNDAPALVRADVGIAIGSGTDVAVESAGIVLVKSNPLDAVGVISLSRASYRKMVQNLAWATGYNVVALPLAAGVAAPWGIVLSPAVGALLMSLSTIIVAINAQLLRRHRIGEAA